MLVARNHVVSFDYSLTAPDGRLIDTSNGKQPLQYLHGYNQIIAGLESAMEGKRAGDEFNVNIGPDQAYGARDPELVKPVPRQAFSGVNEIVPGMQFQASGPMGDRLVTVVGVSETEITIDANHPLAGVPLAFAISVKEIRPATPDEISHGHVHGPGGHEH